MLFCENHEDLVSLSCGELKTLSSPTSSILLLAAWAFYSSLSQSEKCPSHILMRMNNGLDFVEVEEFVPYCDYWYHHNSSIQNVLRNNDSFGLFLRQCGKLCKNVMQLLDHSCWFAMLKTAQHTWRFWTELTDGMINADRFHIYVVCDYLER